MHPRSPFFNTVFTNYVQQGIAALALGNTESALRLLEKAVNAARVAKGHNNRRNLGLALLRLGEAHDANGDSERAVCFLLEALEVLLVTWGPRSNQMRDCRAALAKTFANKGDMCLADFYRGNSMP